MVASAKRNHLKTRFTVKLKAVQVNDLSGCNIGPNFTILHVIPLSSCEGIWL
ncbi:unnamed protein product [Plutella xylostella]|uniref:(diamondback moth) hypothetical protein n=1 Tax=Plutella xylostella TaxID=51655 RepID=A0A8S4GC97_PLUXY|nr:unnamed protein product [Plutella xylostella]